MFFIPIYFDRSSVHIVMLIFVVLMIMMISMLLVILMILVISMILEMLMTKRMNVMFLFSAFEEFDFDEFDFDFDDMMQGSILELWTCPSSCLLPLHTSTRPKMRWLPISKFSNSIFSSKHQLVCNLFKSGFWLGSYMYCWFFYRSKRLHEFDELSTSCVCCLCCIECDTVGLGWVKKVASDENTTIWWSLFQMWNKWGGHNWQGGIITIREGCITPSSQSLDSKLEIR